MQVPAQKGGVRECLKSQAFSSNLPCFSPFLVKSHPSLQFSPAQFPLFSLLILSPSKSKQTNTSLSGISSLSFISILSWGKKELRFSGSKGCQYCLSPSKNELRSKGDTNIRNWSYAFKVCEIAGTTKLKYKYIFTKDDTFKKIQDFRHVVFICSTERIISSLC